MDTQKLSCPENKSRNLALYYSKGRPKMKLVEFMEHFLEMKINQ